MQSRRLSLGCTRVHMLAEMGRVAGRAIASTDVGARLLKWFGYGAYELPLFFGAGGYSFAASVVSLCSEIVCCCCGIVLGVQGS